jgi:hypothetical protein
MEEPFIRYLDKVFCASPIFFYTLTYINNHPAHEVHQAFALPNTISQQDPPLLASIIKKQYHPCAHINLDATKFTGALKEGLNEPFNTTAYKNFRRALDNINLHHFSNFNNQSKGLVIVESFIYSTDCSSLSRTTSFGGNSFELPSLSLPLLDAMMAIITTSKNYHDSNAGYGLNLMLNGQVDASLMLLMIEEGSSDKNDIELQNGFDNSR